MTTMARALSVAVVLFSGWSSLSGDETATPIKTVRKAAQEDAHTPEGRAWEHRIVSWLGPALAPIMKQCGEQSPEGKKKAFTAYVRLSMKGGAHEAVVEPRSPFTECFANGLKELQYPDVPRENYWFTIRMKTRN